MPFHQNTGSSVIGEGNIRRIAQKWIKFWLKTLSRESTADSPPLNIVIGKMRETHERMDVPPFHVK